jgi:hypothetical protein
VEESGKHHQDGRNTDVWVAQTDDYWKSGYGRIIMVPRVKLAYDRVRSTSHSEYPLLVTDILGRLSASILNNPPTPPKLHL